ncbi:exodeoxyribonuclease V subunit beta [Desulfatirhabdium butyrativorans]|uniref:exodeoxyribonuclease V subunit beta n=1 Tax=Desulfatirhabdium butyrativorans TaxID=340467 RepID=UPI00146FA3ED|nr:exodeoxyribonuclease V subunit beta [Desulfatirhabdium butyrativorans]
MNIFQLDLSSPHLIEASAGTGKTWHLVALYLRLIAEGFGIDQVLAVTFTEAAAAELKDRIRSRLRQTFMSLTSGEPGPDVQPFLVVCDAGLLRKRFLRAIVMIDEAQILTIHGFCHAVLRQYAFETGMPFDATLSADTRSTAEEITADWWARTVYPGPAWIAAGLAAGEDTLKTWADLLRKAAARPDLVLLPEDNPSVRAAAADLDSRYLSLRKMWQAEKETIFSLLQRNADGLKANQYPPKKFPVWMSEISAFLEPEGPMMLSSPEGLIRLSASKLQAATRKGASPPVHAFFDLAEKWIETCSACAGVLVQMKREFLQSAIGEWDLRKRNYRVIGFDDLILNLYRSLQGPSGPELVRTLRKRFPAALIDEFQDTDPYQYGIFHAIYPDSGHPFFMIGDPKQAIYGFRGADIFTYLDAVDSVSGNVCRLDTNYRSGAGLIDGINALFQNTAKPFVDDRIRYEAVRAGVQPGALFRLNGERAAPLHIRFIRRSADVEPDRNGFLSLRWMRRNLPELVAAQITEWLCPGGASIDGRPISCEDVAVLVRTNAQAFQMLDALAGHRVPGVMESTHSVWDGPEALWIWRLLRAVQAPGSARRIGGALCSDLFGLDAAGLHGINRSEALAGFWMETFRHWRSLWHRKGIFAMLDAVFASDIRCPEPIGFRRLAGFVGAERHITNLLHVAELLQQAERETRAGPSKLIQWMEARMNGADADGRQESELRLESDEKAVRIVTVHKSKGLEYPIVICPYLWDSGGGKNASSGSLFYHDPQANHRLSLHLDPQEEQIRLNREEAFSESMRLLYVAVTRARHACVVYTAGLKDVESNALGYLLHPGRPEAPSGFRDDDALLDDLLRFKARAPDAIDICPFDPVILEIPLQRPGSQVPDLALQALPPAGIRRVWRITSFSGLTSAQDMPPKPWAERDMDGPDTPSDGAALPAAADESGEVALADFDAGVQAGLLIHAIFEQIDFTDPQGVETEARHQMSRFGFDPARHLGRLCQSVRDVLATPLDAALPDLRLGRVPKRDRLNELGFLFPAAYPGSRSIDAGGLAEAWASGCGEFPSLPKRYAALLQGLPFDAFRGYLKGFIDLVFRWQGRWYIVDYKSNFLGRYFEDYGPERLQEQMFSHHYLLQAAIYALALHRYLSSRLADYSFDRHIGAIYYLFVRGMSPEKGAQSGVYAMQPPKALIEALDSLFRAAGS